VGAAFSRRCVASSAPQGGHAAQQWVWDTVAGAWSVIRCRHKLPILAVCIPLCRQPLRKLVDSIPPPPNWLGWYGDRACCVHHHQIEGVRHAPINAADPATPAFVAGALDWRHRHQSPALVIDHLGDLRRRVVIADVVSSRERLRGYPDPIRDASVIFQRYTSSGPLVGSPYGFSRTSDHIERAVQSTDAWLAQNGLEQSLSHSSSGQVTLHCKTATAGWIPGHRTD
jgi:hypothetical protein